MGNFKVYLSEANKYKYLGKQLSADSESSDDTYDKILQFNDKTYADAEKKISRLVANDTVWKVDYDKDNKKISIRWDK